MVKADAHEGKGLRVKFRHLRVRSERPNSRHPNVEVKRPTGEFEVKCPKGEVEVP